MFAEANQEYSEVSFEIPAMNTSSIHCVGKFHAHFEWVSKLCTHNSINQIVDGIIHLGEHLKGDTGMRDSVFVEVFTNAEGSYHIGTAVVDMNFVVKAPSPGFRRGNSKKVTLS